MPQARPPPPKGTRIASASGRSSRISTPIVPLPAITAGSSKGWTKQPSIPGKERSSNVLHQRSKVTLTTRAPRRSTAAVFAAGAVSGTTTVQGTPRRRAARAAPWAMLPALAVQRAGGTFGRERTAFHAPRILKEPIGWRHSSFRKTSGRRSVAWRGTRGVRRATSETVARARRISSRGIMAPQILERVSRASLSLRCGVDRGFGECVEAAQRSEIALPSGGSHDRTWPRDARPPEARSAPRPPHPPPREVAPGDEVLPRPRRPSDDRDGDRDGPPEPRRALVLHGPLDGRRIVHRRSEERR